MRIKSKKIREEFELLLKSCVGKVDTDEISKSAFWVMRKYGFREQDIIPEISFKCKFNPNYISLAFRPLKLTAEWDEIIIYK